MCWRCLALRADTRWVVPERNLRPRLLWAVLYADVSNVSLELQFRAFRSWLLCKPHWGWEGGSLYLWSSLVYIYFFLPDMPISSENSWKQLCSWLEEFFLRTSTHSILPTCCPQNFLATHTVHEPRRGSPCPIACLEAQPVSCVIINPYLPKTHKHGELPLLRARGLR